MSIEFNNRILLVDDTKDIHKAFISTLSFSGVADSNEDGALDAMASDLFATGDSSTSNIKTVRSSYELTSAFSGDEAVEVVKDAMRRNKPFAVVFMDVRMPPGVDGVQTLSQVWKIDPHLEAVMCSAYSDYNWEETVGVVGKTDQLLYLKKPFEMVEVQQMAMALTLKWNKIKGYRDKLEIS